MDKIQLINEESDLECEGSLIWTEVNPFETLRGSFDISNIGSEASNLDWEILEYPSWGTWTIDPENGENLKSEDGSFTVDVTVIAPDDTDKKLSGEVKIANKDNNEDYEIIDVSLTFPRNKSTKGFVYTDLFNCFSDIFPIFSLLLNKCIYNL